jgi:hypothetical protein
MLDPTAQNVALRYFVANTTVTPDMVAQQIETQLAPLFKDWDFTVYVEKLLGEDFLGVQFYQTPKGSGNLARMNAPKSIKVSISGFKGENPTILKAETSRSRGVSKFRRTQGSPDKVIKAMVGWFRKNAPDLNQVEEK